MSIKFDPNFHVLPKATPGSEASSGVNPVFSEVLRTQMPSADKQDVGVPGGNLFTAGIVPTQNKQSTTIADAIARFNPSHPGYRDWEDNLAFTNS